MTPTRLGRTTYYTLREAASELHERGCRTRRGSRIDHSYLSRERDRGRLRGSKTGEQGNAPVLISQSDLERYAASLDAPKP